MRRDGFCLLSAKPAHVGQVADPGNDIFEGVSRRRRGRNITSVEGCLWRWDGSCICERANYSEEYERNEMHDSKGRDISAMNDDADDDARMRRCGRFKLRAGPSG